MRGLRALVQRIRISPNLQRSLSEVAIGCAIAGTLLALFSQFLATWGTGWGVRIGMLAGTICGLLLPRFASRTAPSDRQLMFWLAAVVLLWPTWLTVQFDLLQCLPTSWWTLPAFTEVVGVLAGLLGWMIPCAIWTQMLFPPSDVQISKARLVRWGTATVGLLVAASILVPLLGITTLTWSALLLASGSLWIFPTESSTEDTTSATTSAADAVMQHGSCWWKGILAGIAGWQIATAINLFSEVMPATLPQWLAGLSLLGMGMGLSFAYSMLRPGVRQQSPTQAALHLTLLGTLQLVVAACLISVCFWLNSRITLPGLLELNRLLLMAVVLMPLGYGIGRIYHGHLSDLVAVLIGYGCVEICALWGLDSLLGCWIGTWSAAVVAVISTVSSLGKTWVPLNFRRLAAPIAMTVLWALIFSSGGLYWQTARATKLLFSTTAAIAARSGWEAPLLPQLDNTHLIAAQSGRHGGWSLWQGHGGTLQLRCQGVPSGSIATQPEWSPQYGPEVAATAWPLTLVDQPARVLLLGTGSSASLQTALSFPVSQVLCTEADTGLLSLLESEVYSRCGFHPLEDDRCQMVRQPAEWLAFPAEEQFDVIVSSVPSATLPQATTLLSSEYYQRAARHLSPQGVFCQRFPTIDFGPTPLLTAIATLQTAFPEVACLEVGTGDFLLLAAHDPAALVKRDLPQRLERSHVAHVLSRCQWDWCTPLNFPAYDRAALAEAVADAQARPMSTANAWLAFFTPRELLRWGPKQQEIAALLQKTRTSASLYPLADVSQPPQLLTDQPRSRRSRYLDWLGQTTAESTVLRRLSEVVSQRELVRQFPDAYWWEYRKELREQLQDRPRTGLQMVSHTVSSDSSRWHPEDQRRKAYFVLLGEALKADIPERGTLAEIEKLLEPYDPLLTLFAHQELADLYSKGNQDPALELKHRLHVIYYAPPDDASVRNVIAAINHLVEHPEAAASDAERFDLLNGLLQVLRTRWEVRNGRPSKSAKVTLQEIERSLVTVEQAIEVLETLSISAGYSTEDWSTRRLVLERLLVRPFRSYRDQLALHTKESRRKTLELLQKANELEDSGRDEANLNSP